MSRPNLKDPKVLYYSLAKKAYENRDYRGCLEYASKLGEAIPPDLKKIVVECAYTAGLKSAAEGRFREATERINVACKLTTDPSLRRLSNDRLDLLRRVKQVPALRKKICPICSKNPNWHEPLAFAPDCLKPEVDQVFCTAVYRSNYDPQRGDPLSTFLRDMKKPGNRDLAEAMGLLLAHFFLTHLNSEIRQEVDLIAPVPTVPSRFQTRGYSIPEILGNYVSQQSSIPSYPTLIAMKRETGDLRHLSRADRRQELADAFSVSKPKMVKGRVVLVIDDITTHGTTLKEIGRTLRKSGARSVFGLIIAHTESSWT